MPQSRYLHYDYLGFLLDGELVGIGMLGYENTYVNGRPEITYHASSLYILPKARGLGIARMSAPHFFGRTWKGSRIGYAIVMTGNKAAKKLLTVTERSTTLPNTSTIGQLEVRNLLCMGRVRKKPSYKVARATWDNLDEMVRFMDDEFRNRLFGPVIDPDALRDRIDRRPLFNISDYYLAWSKGEIVGVAGAWDTSTIKHTTVLRYGPIDRLGVGFLRSLSAFHGTMAFPRAGEHFKATSLVDVAVKGNDPSIMEDLLLVIYEARRRSDHLISFGSFKSDPLLRSTKTFRTMRLRSDIILAVSRDKDIGMGAIDTSRPFIDIAAL